MTLDWAERAALSCIKAAGVRVTIARWQAVAAACAAGLVFGETPDGGREVIAYSSNTRTRRNLAALLKANWRILLSPANPDPPPHFRFAIDNGAWTAHTTGTPFDVEAFSSLVERYGTLADWVVAPDIVGQGDASLEYSLSWMERLRNIQLVLLAVQDGVDIGKVGDALLHFPRAGLFLGGSTEYKLQSMPMWGGIAASLGRWYHVGRVNTARRIRLAEEAGAISFDGTSASRYSVTLPLLDTSRKQRNLFAVRSMRMETELNRQKW